MHLSSWPVIIVDTTAEYDMVADIRKNARGNDSLFHDGFKFSKNGKGFIRQVRISNNQNEKWRE